LGIETPVENTFLGFNQLSRLPKGYMLNASGSTLMSSQSDSTQSIRGEIGLSKQNKSAEFGIQAGYQWIKSTEKRTQIQASIGSSKNKHIHLNLAINYQYCHGFFFTQTQFWGGLQIPVKLTPIFRLKLTPHLVMQNSCS
jgi:hypothetical protein